MAHVQPDIARALLLHGPTLSDAARLAATSQTFHQASKDSVVFDTWAEWQMRSVEVSLSEQLPQLPAYLEWMRSEQREVVMSEEGGQLTLGVMDVLGRFSEPSREVREVLRLLCTRSTRTHSLGYLSVLLQDGVFHVMALIDTWCKASGEVVYHALLRWLLPTDECLWRARAPQAFRWWTAEVAMRRRLPTVPRLLYGASADVHESRRRKRFRGSWDVVKQRWLALFIEEHLVSVGSPHWGIPGRIEQQLRCVAFGHYADHYTWLTREFCNGGLAWGRYVSVREWQGHPQGWRLLAGNGRAACRLGQRGYVPLLRHFGLFIQHAHIVRKWSAEGDAAPVPSVDGMCGFGDDVPGCVAWAAPRLGDPEFWLECPSLALASGPEAPPVVRRALHLQRSPGAPAHAWRRALAQLWRAAADGSAVSEEAREAALAVLQGSVSLIAGQIVRFKQGSEAQQGAAS